MPEVFKDVGLKASVGYAYIGQPYDASYFMDNHAAGYSDYTLQESGGWAVRVADDIEVWYGAVSGKRILDIGCAFGYLTKELTDRGAECLGIDVSSYAIAQAQTLFPAMASEFTVQDIVEGTTFTPGERFDIILSVGVLDCLNLAQKIPALAEMNRIRKVIGKTYCLTERVSNYYHVIEEGSWQLEFGDAFGGLTTITDTANQPLGYDWRLVNE